MFTFSNSIWALHKWIRTTISNLEGTCERYLLVGMIISILLFADDIVLIAHRIPSLQQCLDTLCVLCNTHGLHVNLGKTKIRVFPRTKLRQSTSLTKTNLVKWPPLTHTLECLSKALPLTCPLPQWREFVRDM